MTRPKKATDAHALKRLREGLNRGESAEAAAAALGVSVRTIRRRRRELLGRAPAKKAAPKVRPQPAPKPADPRASVEAARAAATDTDKLADLDLQLLALDNAELAADLASGMGVMSALVGNATFGTVLDQVRTPERIAQLARWVEQDEEDDARRLLESALDALRETELP